MVQVLPINLAFRGALDAGVVFGRPPLYVSFRYTRDDR